MKPHSSSDIAWGKPAKTLDEALKQISNKATTLQFEHRLDPKSTPEVSFARDAGDKITNQRLGDEGVSAVCKALKDNKSITALDLSANKIKSEGLGSIVDMLKSNSTITALYLEDNSLKDKDIEHLSDLLKDNKTLKQLALSGNKISDSGAVALARALKKNKTLESLWLSRNCIRDAGAEKIAKALTSKNKSLSTLSLESNLLRERSAKAFAKALKKNPHLLVLNLTDNKLESKSAKYFNKTLHDLELNSDKDKRGEIELLLNGNRLNEEDLDLLRTRAEGKNVKLLGRNVEKREKEKARVRVMNFLKYHLLDKKYFNKGHFKEGREIEKVL